MIRMSMGRVGNDKETYESNPRLDCSEAQVICIVSFANRLPVINHPADLERREIGGERKTGAVNRYQLLQTLDSRIM